MRASKLYEVLSVQFISLTWFSVIIILSKIDLFSEKNLELNVMKIGFSAILYHTGFLFYFVIVCFQIYEIHLNLLV